MPSYELRGYETSVWLCASSGHFRQSRDRQWGHNLGPDLIRRNTCERCNRDRLILMAGLCLPKNEFHSLELLLHVYISLFLAARYKNVYKIQCIQGWWNYLLLSRDCWKQSMKRLKGNSYWRILVATSDSWGYIALWDSTKQRTCTHHTRHTYCIYFWNFLQTSPWKK